MPVVPDSTATAYATPAELTGWTGKANPADADRLLLRASEIVDAHVTTAFDVDDDTAMPTDALVIAVLRDAVCAQVEHWMTTGEVNDIDGMAGQDVSVSGLSVTRPARLAPRARQQLALYDLL